jgi:CRISPR-associated endonuclease Cas3-HD
VDKEKILSILRKVKPLFFQSYQRPEKMLEELASLEPSKQMVFPCDIIDFRYFLINDKISSSNPIPLFSQVFAEKYLKDNSLFLVLDTDKIEPSSYKKGGLYLIFCDELSISDLVTRIIINEPAANNSFDVVKDLIEEFGLGVECLVSNSIPGLSNPGGTIANTQENTHKTAQRIVGKKTDIPLSQKEKDIFEFLRRVKKDRGLNVQMRVAGGWVRDKLLGKESDDIDIAVDMPGYDFAQIVADEAYKNNITHDPKAYKVSLEKSADPNEREPSDDLMVGSVNLFGQKIEFVPMRTEHYPDPNSRQPQITTTNDPQEDVKRRDLTINSIYYNIDTGQIDDFVGGVKDLGLKDGKMILRTPDETKKTYMEDPLRLLRALRFHSRYPNSVVDPEIVESMSDPSIQEAYAKKVATERAGPEIVKMMMGENPVSSVKILFDSGLYKNVFKVPSMEDLNEEGIHMDQQTPYHKYNLKDHTLEVVNNLNNLMKGNGESDYMRGLMNVAALFHDFGKMKSGVQKPHPKNEGQMQYIGHELASSKMANEILKSIGVGKDDRDIVNQVISLHMRPHGADKWGPKGKGNFLRKSRMHGKDEEHKDLWKYILHFNKADEMSSQPDNFDEKKYQNKFDSIRNFVESPAGSFRGTVLNGNDIIVLFPQLKPSSGFIKEVLNYVKELQDTNKIDVSGDISIAKQQAIDAVQQISSSIIDKYKEPTMSSNWFKKTKVSQVAPLSHRFKDAEDPEVKKGPNAAVPEYYVGMKVRDRRKGLSSPQDFGEVKVIDGTKMKIRWRNEDRKDEIFDVIEDTAVLSYIIEEV